MKTLSELTNQLTAEPLLEIITRSAIILPDFGIDDSAGAVKSAPAFNSPLVVCRLGEKYLLTDGYRRLSRSANEQFTCIVYPDVSKDQATLMRIMINRQREFSFKEKIQFYTWVTATVDEADRAALLSLLNIQSSEKNSYEHLLTSPPAVQDAVARGDLDLIAAATINNWDDHDLEALLTFFKQFQFSRSLQREIIEWLPEIAFRENITISQILTISELHTIISDPKTNPPQKMQKIRDFLFEKRYPFYAKTFESWKKLAQKWNPDKSKVQFKSSPGFEKDKLEISISITQPSQITVLLKQLESIPEEIWQTLIYPAEQKYQ